MFDVATLKAWIKRQGFMPSPFPGLLVNSAYIPRRGLYKAFAVYAPRLGGRVMDFGAGMSPYRGLFVAASDYVAVDIVESGHPGAQKSASVFYDGHTLPFADASFDGAFASEVFEHVFNLDEVLAEVRRVLRPGGWLLFSCPFVWDEHEIPYDFARYTSYGLRHLVVRQGFEVVEQRKTTSYLAAAFALVAAYVEELAIFRPWLPRQLAKLLLIFPLNALGVALGAVLPRNDRLYANNVFLCRRPAGDPLRDGAAGPQH